MAYSSLPAEQLPIQKNKNQVLQLIRQLEKLIKDADVQEIDSGGGGFASYKDYYVFTESEHTKLETTVKRLYQKAKRL